VVTTATLMATDSWFDLPTSAPGRDLALATAEAALVELPLTAAALWLAHLVADPDHLHDDGHDVADDHRSAS